VKTKLEIARNWLPRYTGTSIDKFGDYILLTNFHNYVERFAEQFGCEVKGEGTSNDYLPKEVPALPSFKLHKFVSNKLVEYQLEYRTGVIYTSNRRVWEWDNEFKQYLAKLSAIGIDMETATIFIVGHANEISRGALLLVSDMPLIPEGIKTEELDIKVNDKYLDLHLKLGVDAMTEIEEKGEAIRHFRY